jgi:hypothetical protein
MPKNRYRIFTMLLLMWLVVACGQPATVEIVIEVTATPIEEPSAPATATPQPMPTATVVPTMTAVPVRGPDALETFAKTPQKRVWTETFDDVTSGWEPRFEDPAVQYGMPAYNMYADGAYEFTVRADDKSALLWDFNNQQPLPNYPYTVLAEVQAERDSYAVMLMDYQGDFGTIDTGSGIAVMFSLKEQETTLGPEFSWGRGAEVAVYEFRNGETWALQCDTQGKWPEIRTAVIAAYVDENRVGIELAPQSDTPDRVTKICRRSAPDLRNGPAYLGLGAMHASSLRLFAMSPEAQAADVGKLRYESIVVAQRDDSLKWPGGMNPADKIRGGNCLNDDTRQRITVELRQHYGYDGSMCDRGAADGETTPIQIVPYQANSGELIGSWRCGNDAENRFTLSQRGDFLQLTNMYSTYGVIAITDDWAPERGEFLYVSNTFLTRNDYVYSTDQLAIGMRLFPGYNLVMVYRDGVLKTNWAGDCVREG